MPPKDDANVIDGTLYFEDENGKLKPISVTCNAELTTDADLEDIIPEEYRLSTAHEFSFSLENAPQFSIKLFKLMYVNNYRRFHSLRPVRHKIRRHNPIAAKRIEKLFKRGGKRYSI